MGWRRHLKAHPELSDDWAWRAAGCWLPTKFTSRARLTSDWSVLGPRDLDRFEIHVSVCTQAIDPNRFTCSGCKTQTSKQSELLACLLDFGGASSAVSHFVA